MGSFLDFLTQLWLLDGWLAELAEQQSCQHGEGKAEELALQASLQNENC